LRIPSKPWVKGTISTNIDSTGALLGSDRPSIHLVTIERSNALEIVIAEIRASRSTAPM